MEERESENESERAREYKREEVDLFARQEGKEQVHLLVKASYLQQAKEEAMW